MLRRFLLLPLLCLLGSLAGNLSDGQTGYLAAQEPAVIQDTAEVLYRFPSGGLISTGPVARAGLVWYMTDSRTMHVLDENGTALGKRTMSGRQLAFIVCDPFGRALVPDGSSSLMLLNRSGQAVWTWRLPQPLQYPPVFDAAGRAFLLAGRTLQLLAPNGSLLWQRELPEACSAAPLPGSGNSVLLAFQGGRVQFWSGDGVLLGETRLNGELEQAAAFSGGYCLAAGGRLHWLDSTGQALAAKQAEAAEAAGGGGISTAQGTAQRLPSLSALLVQDELAWSLAADGRLQAWTVDNLLTSDTTTPHRNGRLVYKGGKLLLLSTARAGSYNLKGELLRELRLVNNASEIQVGDSGALFAGGRDWILYAYRFERPFPAENPAFAQVSEDTAAAALSRELFWLPGGLSNRESVSNRLLDIEKSVKSGTIGRSRSEALAFTAAIALGLSGFSEAASGARPDLPLRVQACALLGVFADASAVPLLAGIFTRERESVLRSAAALAIADIGLDIDGSAMRAFADAGPQSLDARTAAALVSAVEAIQLGGAAMDSRAAATALVRLLGPLWPRSVRDRAAAALDKIRAEM